MKKIGFLFAFAFVFSIHAFSQLKHDYIWTMGYGQIWPSSDGYPFGGVLMDFNTVPPTFTLVNYLFDTPKAAISDKNGQLVAYTNGCRIINKNHEGMVNGDTLNPGEVYEEFCTVSTFSSYPLWQPCIFLPKPNSDSLYYLFHLRNDDDLWNPMNLMYSVVDASKESGAGSVISKNNSVLSDSIFLGNYVTATRHANGRDWWVVVPRRFSNNIHVTLLNDKGAEYMGMQVFDSLNLGIDSIYWASQTAFSVDGSKYFHNSHDKLLIFNFDRCTGILSNPVSLDWDFFPFGGGGVATSSNSRFLYLTSGNTVQQYDLWATDLAASMQVVAVYDGFEAPFPSNFFQMMPGPDGKIYIITAFDNNILHVIHNPNELGLGCNVEQHALTLPARQSYFINNFANYNLGPVDGGLCDSLGIDNLPIARFHWNLEDTLSPQQILFTDYSYHEPTIWHWDFGDATTSQDTNPVHLYTSPGIYVVCLTVCNENACDTICHEIEIKTVKNVILNEQDKGVSIWPNPAGNMLHIQAADTPEFIQILDGKGRKVLELSPNNFSNGIVSFRINQLPPDVYLLTLWIEGKVFTGKFIKG